MLPYEHQMMTLSGGTLQERGRAEATPASQLAVPETVPIRVHLVVHGTGHNESSCLPVLQMGLLLVVLGSN